MAHYDNEEQRKLSQSLSEKLERVRSMKPEDLDRVKELLGQIEEAVLQVRERAEMGTATKEDLEFLDMASKRSAELKQMFEDAHLLLSDHMYKQATAYYHHVKKLAEEGNKEAQEVYEQLKPLYQKALMADDDKPEQLN